MPCLYSAPFHYSFKLDPILIDGFRVLADQLSLVLDLSGYIISFYPVKNRAMKAPKLLIILLSILLFSEITFGQAGCLPMNKDKGQIEYRGRIKMNDITKDEVYNKVLRWGVTKALSDREILKDREAGILKFQVKVNYKYKDILKPAYFSVALVANNGFFEYTIDAFLMNNKAMEIYVAGKAHDPVYNAAFADICKKVQNSIYELRYLKPDE